MSNCANLQLGHRASLLQILPPKTLGPEYWPLGRWSIWPWTTGPPSPWTPGPLVMDPWATNQLALGHWLTGPLGYRALGNWPLDHGHWADVNGAFGFEPMGRWAAGQLGPGPLARHALAANQLSPGAFSHLVLGTKPFCNWAFNKFATGLFDPGPWPIGTLGN